MRYIYKIIIGLLEFISMMVLFVWMDHCNCEGKVSREIKKTFTVTQEKK